MTLIATQGGYGTILQPARVPHESDILPFRPGVSLTIRCGQAMAIKTADRLLYPFASGSSDGTENFAGFSQYAFKTDANGLAYLGGDSSVATPILQPNQLVPLIVRGVFYPTSVSTNATLTANVVTYTPGGTITTGDINTVTYTLPNGTTQSASFTVAGTTTATAVSNGLRTAWNANPVLVALATASGTSTFILTATVPGNDIAGVLAPNTPAVGTLTEANTTAAAGRVFSQIVTSRPGSYLDADGLWHVI